MPFDKHEQNHRLDFRNATELADDGIKDCSPAIKLDRGSLQSKSLVTFPFLGFEAESAVLAPFDHTWALQAYVF